MKKEFKPIAMKCTEEQFNAFKPILEENGLEMYQITDFSYTPYLVNNLGKTNGNVANVVTCSKNNYNRTVFEEWNQDIFLEYCGIDVELKFRPIAMKCTEGQFNAIRPILEANGGEINDIESFDYLEYLVNNSDGIPMRISNFSDYKIDQNGRTVFEEWNQDTFLEYCGIEVKPEFRPIAMRCNQEQFDAIKPILEENGLEMYNITSFKYERYLVNNLAEGDNCVSNVRTCSKNNYNRTVFEEWNQDIFLEYCGIKKQTEKTMGYKLTVPATDVLGIHKIACNRWKRIISNYLTRVDSEQNITFTEKEVDDMFEAATLEQKPVLTKIFGEKKKEIDYNKLKTGSRVMIKYSGQHCGGIVSIDKDEPVDIVFYKTPHFIPKSGKFTTMGAYTHYITFHQNGKFVLFSAHEEIDYITEVIEY